ncbi:DNA replication and repair protein RecF [bacterium]|nr:DNA replication and repair protein RecF [bacterium]
MRLKRLKLRDFRNYERLDLEFPAGIIVLAGANGAGKSNLLEAIHYLSYLKSFRTNRDREVVRYSCPLALIEARLADDDERPFDARLVLKSGKRHVRLNGNDITRFQDFIGRLHSQFFFPGDLTLLTGDPTLRREVLDLELLRLKPVLLPVYQKFRNALKQRNSVLKLLYPQPGRRHNRPVDLLKALEAYTEQLIGAGVAIMRERRGITKVLNEQFVPLYARLAPPEGESVSLRYLSAVPLEPDDQLAANYRRLLSESQETEASLRFTTVGPHRDDLGFILDGERDLKRYGSQGQQRSAALTFRLALAALSRQRLSDDPLLLLDDALSEMDDERKQRLLAICRQHRQVFITSASQREVDLISPLATVVYTVEDGLLAPAGSGQ